MIILEGPALHLREAVRHELEARLRAELGELLTVHASGTPGLGALGDVVRLLNTPNQTQLRDGLTLDFIYGHPVHHMAGYALNATGSVIITCVPAGRRWTHMDSHPLCDHLPNLTLWSDQDVAEGLDLILRTWRERQVAVATTYPFGGTGYPEEGGVMVVGERVNPFRPFGDTRQGEGGFPAAWLAFTSNQGCSMFLHDALRHAGGRYYLTNALKTQGKRLNRELLERELALMRPGAVVAMGSEAAGALADLKVDFVRTDHPQYWNRFRKREAGELVELFRRVSASITKPTT